VKRLLAIAFVLCATIALCAQTVTPPEMAAIAKLPPPAVVLVYRTLGIQRVPRFEQVWVYSYRGFATEAEALKFLGDEDMPDDRFVGLYKVGAKVEVQVQETTEVVAPKKVRKWRKP